MRVTRNERRQRVGVVASALILALSGTLGANAATGAPVRAEQAAMARTVEDGATTAAVQQSTLRVDSVRRAKALLNNPQDFKARQGGITRKSRPKGDRNHLEYQGSNANRNEFNGFNGLDWCGYFIAAAWTGHNVPSASSFPRIPRNYPRSQAWRTEVGDRYHRFSTSRLPRMGDVLIWQNGSGAPGQDTGVATGHVAMVVGVNRDTKRVTTVEGNVLGDEIARRSYAWDSNGPTLEGKHFMGFTSRE